VIALRRSVIAGLSAECVWMCVRDVCPPPKKSSAMSRSRGRMGRLQQQARQAAQSEVQLLGGIACGGVKYSGCCLK
jgi:hypothetical protein